MRQFIPLRVFDPASHSRRGRSATRSGRTEPRQEGLLVGAGTLHAADQVTEVADTLRAGVAEALLAKAVLHDNRPVRRRFAVGRAP